METFTINGNIISGDEPKSADASDTKYIYVQGHGPMNPDQKRELRERQIRFHEYLGGNAYLCGYDPHDLQQIQILDFVARANVYPKRVKISRSLRKIMEDSSGYGTAIFLVNVIFHETDEPVKEMIDELMREIMKELPELPAEDVSVDHDVLRLNINKDMMDLLTGHDAVKTIEAHTTVKFTNDIATHDMYAPRMGDTGDPSYLYEGQDIVVAVADAGFDLGDSDNVHPAFQGRVLHLYSGPNGSTDDPLGHGTHVAGSILGDGDYVLGGRIRGTAPKAKLIMQSLLAYDQNGDPCVEWSPSLRSVIESPYRDHHARISSNSWSSTMRRNQPQIEYDFKARTVDEFIWENQDHVMLFSAGNDGQNGAAAQIGSISAAKNCITVGATESSRRIDQDRTGFDPNGQRGLMDIVARFSSVGPTVEQRTKPDVVAPGVAILSAASRHTNFTAQQRSACGVSQDPLWTFMSGTSMSTPLVAGCCAILREALARTRDVRDPSAALIKALLINGAIHETRITETQQTKRQQGFGHVDMSRSLKPVDTYHAVFRAFVDEGFGTRGQRLAEGESWRHLIALPELPNKPTTKLWFRVTLAYTDPPGKSLQNFLALSLEVRDGRGVDTWKNTATEENVQKLDISVEVGPDPVIVAFQVTAERITRHSQGFAIVWDINNKHF